MKQLLYLIPILLLLTGCSFAPDEYYSATAHESEQVQMPDAVEVTDKEGLHEAILRFVKAGKPTGTIRTVDYDGNVEEDLVQAVYDVSRVEPVGAYAVDYLNHTCAKIVNYYEIKLSITYRRTGQEIAAIQQAYTSEQLKGQVERALKTYDDRLALQVTEDQEYDIEALVDRYCMDNPAVMIERPELAVSVYPESGTERIVEVEFFYDHPPEELSRRMKAVEESVSAAAEYIRYRNTDRDKTLLLYTYLTQRFTYVSGEGTASVYAALCEGVADPEGLAQGFTMICRRAGVECYTVSGLRDGEAYYWNIVADDGDYRHVDLAQCILKSSGLRLFTDWEMGRYYWDTRDYPACVVHEEPAPPAEEPAPEEPAPDGETEQPAEEEIEPEEEAR